MLPCPISSTSGNALPPANVDPTPLAVALGKPCGRPSLLSASKTWAWLGP